MCFIFIHQANKNRGPPELNCGWSSKVECFGVSFSKAIAGLVMGTVRLRHCSHHFATQSSHFVADRAGCVVDYHTLRAPITAQLSPTLR